MKITANIIWCICLTLVSNCIHPQTWENLYGEPDRADYSYGVVETYDHGYLMAGGFENDKSWIIKTDINGNVLWDKVLECEGYNLSWAIVQSLDGGFLITGLMHVINNTSYPFIAKFSPCMEKEWCRIFQISGLSSMSRDVIETETGDVVIVVNNNGFTQNEQLYLFKLDKFGDVLWGNAYVKKEDHPKAANPTAKSLLLTSDSNYLVSGYVYWENPWGPTGHVFQRSLFLKVDQNGNEEWVLPFGLQDTIYSKSFMSIEVENGFIGVGTDRTGPKFQGFFMRFDHNGNEINYNTIDFNTVNSSFNCGQFNDIQKIDSLFIVGGAFGDLDNDDYFPGEMVFDTNIFEQDYTIFGYKRHPNTGSLYDMTITHDSKILTNTVYETNRTEYDIYLSKMNLQLEFDSIYTANIQYDSLCPGGIVSGTISLDDCLVIVDIDDLPSQGDHQTFLSTIPILIYPNPANTEVNFSFENTEHHADLMLECYDLVGRKVYKTTLIRGQKGVSTSVIRWPAGLYVAVVTSRGIVVGKGKFVVQN